VAVAQLVGETCHDLEQGPEANQSRALQEDFLELLNQGDASQPYGSPLIELQGDAFEGSCSQIEPRKTPPPRLAFLDSKAMHRIAEKLSSLGSSNFQTFAAVQGDAFNPTSHPEHLDPDIHVSYCSGVHLQGDDCR
jgi:hypothetical protein